MYLLQDSFGQAPNLAKIVPPSPNMQAFQKYGDIPIGAYTGIPNISIPLYTIKYKDITVPISLSYHASGIKVAEEASQVGLGWVIDNSGSISRNINGIDDLQDPAYFNSTYNSIQDFNGNTASIDMVTSRTTLRMFSRPGPNSLYNYPIRDILGSSPPFDFQPDQFYYNFPGHDGKFVMTRAKQAIIQKREKINISLLGTTGNYTWEITSNDGFIYDFTAIETYHDMSDHTSAWYLTKITSPNGNTITYNYTNVNRYVTTFGSYADSWDYYDPLVPIPGSSTYYQSPNTGRQKGQVAGKQYNLVVLDNIDFHTGMVKFNYSDRADVTNDTKLDNLMIYSKDGNGNLSAQPLKTVSLTYDYFNQGDGDNDDDMLLGGDGGIIAYERLRLLSVQQQGNYNGNAITENPYIFTYNSQHLPSKGSFARDHWGYYNGKTSNTSLIPTIIPVYSPDPIVSTLGVEGTERDAVAGFAGAGSLASIKYPSGGTTEFQFESNDYDETNSQINDASYFSKDFATVLKSEQLRFDNQEQRVTLPSDTLNLTDEYIFKQNAQTSGTSPTVSLNLVFRFANSPGTGVSSACTFQHFIQDGKVTVDIYDITGNILLYHNDPHPLIPCSGSTTEGCTICDGPTITVNTSNLYLGPGKYLVKVFVDPAFLPTDISVAPAQTDALQDIFLNFSYYANVSSTKNYVTGQTTTYNIGGGQRIAEIIDHSDPNSSSNIRKYIYHYTSAKSGSNADYSYGRRMSHPVYSSFTTSSDAITVETAGSAITGLTTGLHLMRSADSDNPLNGSAAGNVVGYDQVTELNGENGENGKTVYKYLNIPDTVLAYNDTTYQLPLRPPNGSNYPSLQNGMLTEQTDYINRNNVFYKIKDVNNTYGVMADYPGIITGLDIRPMAINEIDYGPGAPTSTSTTSPEIVTILQYTALRSEYPFPLTSDQKIFDQLDTTKYLETLTTNVYSPTDLQPTQVTTTNSKGELVKSYYKYPLDYTSLNSLTTPSDALSHGIYNLIGKNIVSPAIEKYTQISNADGTSNRTTSATFTSYKLSPSLPDVIQTDTITAPLTDFVPSNFTLTSHTLDSRYQPFVNFNSYDSDGNITQQQKNYGINNSYIWDYNNSLPIAEVKNALPTDIAYTSFEAIGNGNWTVTSSARGSSAMTGSASYSVGSGLSKGGLTSSKTYIVSYWTNGSSPFSIAGTVAGYPVKGATTPSGWTYYEHKVTGQTTVSFTGTGNIDEVRLYPLNAQMTSYTYVPLIGVTTVDDARGMVNYYDYDGLGRLIDIRDVNGNIVKSFIYHYQGQ